MRRIWAYESAAGLISSKRVAIAPKATGPRRFCADVTGAPSCRHGPGLSRRPAASPGGRGPRSVESLCPAVRSLAPAGAAARRCPCAPEAAHRRPVKPCRVRRRVRGGLPPARAAAARCATRVRAGSRFSCRSFPIAGRRDFTRAGAPESGGRRAARASATGGAVSRAGWMRRDGAAAMQLRSGARLHV